MKMQHLIAAGERREGDRPTSSGVVDISGPATTAQAVGVEIRTVLSRLLAEALVRTYRGDQQAICKATQDGVRGGTRRHGSTVTEGYPDGSSSP